MRSCLYLFALAIFFASFNESAWAVKAYLFHIEITQSDGTKITIIQKGDERVKWAETIDGYSLLRNSKGIFEYAKFDINNNLIPSGIKAKNLKERSNSDHQFLSQIPKGIVFSKSQVKMMKSISKIYREDAQIKFPTSGDIKILCVLMNFTDKQFSLQKTDFVNLFNQTNYSIDGASGSVNDYYKENSYGKFNLIVDVAGIYTADNNMAYYGANDVSGNDINPQALIKEAVTKADPYVNFADYDNNGDGYVDGVHVIYAGYGEDESSNENEIWAHQWQIVPIKLDGKYVSIYSCSSELRSSSGTGISRIGVICHELGHIFGAPDFYDTDDTDNGLFYGTGSWDIMADGSWNNNGITPSHHNPYTKIYIYKWATATTISTASTITLYNAAENLNSFYRINTQTANEYFLIENRQKLKFDNYLPGHGMIIYHVDGTYIDNHSNDDNINVGSHQGLYPVCANSLTNPGSTANSFGNINSGGCPFPGTGLKTSFSDYTTPNSLSWAYKFTNVPISSILENDINKTVSFKVSITIGVNDIIGEKSFLKQNYPNPFDQSTTIDFSIDKSAHVILAVFNALGQQIDVLVNEYLAAGDHSKVWTPDNISSGIYFYQLQVDGVKETKRLIKK